MLIGDLVRKSGFSKDTIRFYEKTGLISVGKKERRTNNYKEYSEHTLSRLHTIKRLKLLGFTLQEIGALLDLASMTTVTCARFNEAIAEKLNVLDQKITELTLMRASLAENLSLGRCCPSQPLDQPCRILDLEH